MAKRSTLQQLMDSGVQFTEMSRKQAESAVKSWVKAGQVRRSEAEANVQMLLERGKETAAQIAEAVQAEVTKQLGWLANRVDDLEEQIEGFVSRLTPGQAAAPAKRTAAKKAPAKRTAAKKAPVKKAPAKRTAARKSPAKKAAATASTE
jgi:polyhydroxyalkanoate synthesis regulator phasin